MSCPDCLDGFTTNSKKDFDEELAKVSKDADKLWKEFDTIKSRLKRRTIKNPEADRRLETHMKMCNAFFKIANYLSRVSFSSAEVEEHYKTIGEGGCAKGVRFRVWKQTVKDHHRFGRNASVVAAIRSLERLNIVESIEGMRSMRDKAVAELLEECILHMFEGKKTAESDSKVSSMEDLCEMLIAMDGDRVGDIDACSFTTEASGAKDVWVVLQLLKIYLHTILKVQRRQDKFQNFEVVRKKSFSRVSETRGLIYQETKKLLLVFVSVLS